jgi:hypothetical protein
LIVAAHTPLTGAFETTIVAGHTTLAQPVRLFLTVTDAENVPVLRY